MSYDIMYNVYGYYLKDCEVYYGLGARSTEQSSKLPTHLVSEVNRQYKPKGAIKQSYFASWDLLMIEHGSYSQ